MNIVALLTLLAGGVLGALVAPLSALFPKQATLINAILAPVGIVAVLAGVIAQFIVAAQKPASSIVQDAPVVNNSGIQVATNVSSTSNLLPKPNIVIPPDDSKL